MRCNAVVTARKFSAGARNTFETKTWVGLPSKMHLEPELAELLDHIEIHNRKRYMALGFYTYRNTKSVTGKKAGMLSITQERWPTYVCSCAPVKG